MTAPITTQERFLNGLKGPDLDAQEWHSLINTKGRQDRANKRLLASDAKGVLDLPSRKIITPEAYLEFMVARSKILVPLCKLRGTRKARRERFQNQRRRYKAQSQFVKRVVSAAGRGKKPSDCVLFIGALLPRSII